MSNRSQRLESVSVDPRRLTAHANGAGCGCKLSAGELHSVFAGMQRVLPTRPEVLVGPESFDDAGVVALGDGRTLVQSVDLFTPVVDDPFDWGRITAANALSDIYAMGAEPLTALQILCWPRALDASIAARVLDGAAQVLDEARCAVLGGHSIDDPTPKFGLAVTGLADHHPTTNAGGRPGDLLVLTKALGTGVVSTAGAAGAAEPAVLDAAVASMVRLNGEAARLASDLGARAVTDVTGFGLVGHLLEVCRASDVSAEVYTDALPVLAGVGQLIVQGHISGGSRRNLADAEAAGVDHGAVPEVDRWLAVDAQTSGGLLVALAPEEAGAFATALIDRGHPAAVVGALGSPDPDRPVVRLRRGAR